VEAMAVANHSLVRNRSNKSTLVGTTPCVSATESAI
jgi:hypothetical protein